MISTEAEVKSLPSGIQNVLGNGRLNCLRYLPPTTEVRTEMHRIRIHKIPDSKSRQIWAHLNDGGGRHGVVGVFGLSMVRMLKMLMMRMILSMHYGRH